MSRGRASKILPLIAYPLSLLFVTPSFAAAPADELEQARQEIASSRERQSKMGEEHKALEGELKELQQQLVKSAASVQKAEADVDASEEKLRLFSKQTQGKTAQLAAHEKQMAALVQAALRLSRMPPEAALTMPEDLDDSMKAARTLRMITEDIRKEMDSISLQVKELRQLEARLEERRDELKRVQASLDGERKGLQAQVTQRRALQETLGREQQREARKVAELAKKAQDMQALIAKLKRDERTAEEREAAKKGKRSFAEAKGRILPPLSGKLMQRFGEGAKDSATRKGVVVKARGDAQVVAPFDGEVVYAGTFLNYGRLVIIRHADEFHTLMAGLSRIDVAVGEFMLEGEPIGAMGDSESESRLYIELRKNNQPIDPRPWIKNL